MDMPADGFRGRMPLYWRDYPKAGEPKEPENDMKTAQEGGQAPEGKPSIIRHPQG